MVSRKNVDRRVMSRNVGVYAREKKRYRDHAANRLSELHRVIMNTETRSRTMANVAFLDWTQMPRVTGCLGCRTNKTGTPAFNSFSKRWMV